MSDVDAAKMAANLKAAADRIRGDPALLAAIEGGARAQDDLRRAIANMGGYNALVESMRSLAKLTQPDLSLMANVAKSISSGSEVARLARSLDLSTSILTRKQLEDVAGAAVASAARLADFDVPLVPARPLESSETIVLRSVRDELKGLALIMSEAAQMTAAQAKIADAMLTGIQELGGTNEDLLAESQALRSTLVVGQQTSDRLGGRVLKWTWVLLGFTVVLAILAIPVTVDAAIRVGRAFGWLPPGP